MSWRKYENHQQETAAVKNHLQKQGYNVLKVNHHRGTAWAWLRVYVQVPRPKNCYCKEVDGKCDPCHELWRRIYTAIGSEVRGTTGRSGDHGGEILIEIEIQ